jgi:hypothetical protein
LSPGAAFSSPSPDTGSPEPTGNGGPADVGGGPEGGGEPGEPAMSPEAEVAAIEDGGGAPAGGDGAGAEPTDPALMPGFEVGLANLSQLLQGGDMDSGELRRITDELDDPAVAGLARELLTLLDGNGGGGGGVPQDAFGGTTTVVLPGMVTYRPAPAEATPATQTESVFQPAGFALYHF